MIASLDGHIGMDAAFDGIEDKCKELTQFKLFNIKQHGDAIVFRYEVK